MTWGQVLIAGWICLIACLTLSIWFRVEGIRREIQLITAGQQIVYTLIMHLMGHECPEYYAKVKAEIAAEAFRRGLVDLEAKEHSE